jgi:hypothetical protein
VIAPSEKGASHAERSVRSAGDDSGGVLDRRIHDGVAVIAGPDIQDAAQHLFRGGKILLKVA